MSQLTLRLVATQLVFVIATSARAYEIGPQADAFVSQANPGNNYGGGGAIAVAAPGLPSGQFQSVLKFNLEKAKFLFDTNYGAGNWKLASVALQLTAAFPNSPLFNSSAAGEIAASWMQDDSWTEGSGVPAAPGATGITWNTLSSFLSPSDESLGSFSFSGATSGTNIYSLTTSPGLNSDATAGGLASIRLLPGQDDTTVSGLFNSRSNASTFNRPVLILEAAAIPEPATCAVASVGALTVAIWTRRGRVGAERLN